MGTRFESRRRRTLGRCMCRMVTELQNVSSFPEGGGESNPRESRNICFHPRANSASNSAGFPPITSSPTRSPTLHLVDVRLTSMTRLINITYLLTYLLRSGNHNLLRPLRLPGAVSHTLHPRVWDLLPHSIIDDPKISEPAFKLRLKTFFHTVVALLRDSHCICDPPCGSLNVCTGIYDRFFYETVSDHNSTEIVRACQ